MKALARATTNTHISKRAPTSLWVALCSIINLHICHCTLHTLICIYKFFRPQMISFSLSLSLLVPRSFVSSFYYWCARYFSHLVPVFAVGYFFGLLSKDFFTTTLLCVHWNLFIIRIYSDSMPVNIIEMLRVNICFNICVCTRNLFANKIQFASFVHASLWRSIFLYRIQYNCSGALFRLLLLGVHMHLLTFLCTRIFWRRKKTFSNTSTFSRGNKKNWPV